MKEKIYATKHREKRNALRLKNLQKTREARKLICKKSFDKNYLKDKSKHKTRKATKIALDHGKIIKQPCKYCGDVKSQVHHNDYKDPFNVTWMCKKHHDAWHRAFEADI